VTFDEVEAALHAVEHDDAQIHQLEEFEAGEADGARADDEHGFAGLRVAALHRVAADGERFDERELVVAEVVADMEFARGHDPCGLAQAAIDVDAEHLHTGAAVGCAFAAGRGGGIVDVGFQRAAVAGLELGDSFARFEDLESEFVAGDAWIGKKRHLAQITGQIRTADAHAVRAHQRLAGAG
jgi:hypothetical protein